MMRGLLWLLLLAAPVAAERPNILWIVADDLSPDLGCYGDPAVRTPHLDRLAAQGRRYDAAFTTAPVCSSSRSAFFTGMYQTSIGAHNHRSHRDDGHRLPEGVRHIAHHLQAAGYFTTLVTGLKVGANGKLDYNFAARRADLFPGKSWRARPPGKPFFAYANFKEPHRGFVRPDAVVHPVDPDQVKLPPYYVDDPVTRADWAAYLNTVQVLDRKVGALLRELEEDGLAKSTVVIFFGDHGRPHFRAKQFLYDGGIRVPLIVRSPHAPPGSVSKDLVSAIDITATTLWLAGIDRPKSMQGRVFLGPDAKPRDVVFAARDRCDGTVDRIRCVRDKRYKYILNFMPERPYGQLNAYKERSYPGLPLMRDLYARGQLTRVQAAFFAPTRPKEELYDLKEDPWETRNLAQDDKHAETLARLRRRLHAWIEETHDQGARPEDPEMLARLLERERKRAGRQR